MKLHLPTLFFAFLVALTSCQTEVNESRFNTYFTDQTLRIDYFHTGDAKSETVSIDDVYQYQNWAGSMKNLVDTLNYGGYYYKVYDEASKELIYSKGFDSYFKEYQVSQEAIDGNVKQFHESAIIPMPQKAIVFALEKRNSEGEFDEVFRTSILPSDTKNVPIDNSIQTYTTHESGNPHIKADIVFVGEGYTAEEAEKFKSDVDRFTKVLFETAPFSSYKNEFNVRGVLKPSEDSGIDEPRAGIDKNTAISATFNTMDSERYILTEDNKALRDISGHVPYDIIFIMVNSTRYGGGGIYNFYSTFTSDNVNSEYIMIHEQGHSVYGLADEYYTSATAYTDFYALDKEPAEPNITALLDPENVKWKHLLSENMEVPTPWEKEKFDSIDFAWQKRRAALNNEIFEMQKNGAPAEKIKAAKENYDRESLTQDTIVNTYLAACALAGKTGVFEGAGYMLKGMYRPSLNCVMFSRINDFCPVCQEAITNIIHLYAE